MADFLKEPVRELLKFKYKTFRFNNLAVLLRKVQPKYQRRLKWRIIDAALASKSPEAVVELDSITDSFPDELDMIYPAIRAYLLGDTQRASDLALAICTSDDIRGDIRVAAFFLSRIFVTETPARSGDCDLPHFQFWDRNPPRDVQRLLERWRREVRDRTWLFDDEDARAFIESSFGAEQAAAYDRCPHPAAKADLFRLCVMYRYGGTYSDADTTPCAGFRSFRQSLTRRSVFWVASDSGFFAHNWFLATPPGTKIYELFVEEATARLTSNPQKKSILSLAGPSMIADVVLTNAAELWHSDSIGAFTNFFGEKTIMGNVSPKYKYDARGWQVFEGGVRKRKGFLAKFKKRS